MHNTASDYYGFEEQYFSVNLDPGEFKTLASHFNSDFFRGANITVPYKELFFDYVDEVDGNTKRIGAINTIIKQNYKLIGTNTDIYGFLQPLKDFKEKIEGGKAIVFGTGGAAKAIVYALIQYGLKEIILISRSPGKISFSFKHYEKDQVYVKSYDEWPVYSEDANLIINTTPLGMEPDIQTSPVKNEEKQFLTDKICYDIVYKPLKTIFLRFAEEAGATTIGGLEMLIHQGSKSFELWTGKPFPIPLIRETLYEHLGH